MGRSARHARSSSLVPRNMRSPTIPNPSSLPDALQENEVRYRLLTEALPQYVWTTDAEGNFDYCNRHLLEYCGLSLKDIQAGRIREFVHPEDLPELSEKVRTQPRDGGAIRTRVPGPPRCRWRVSVALRPCGAIRRCRREEALAGCGHRRDFRQADGTRVTRCERAAERDPGVHLRVVYRARPRMALPVRQPARAECHPTALVRVAADR